MDQKERIIKLLRESILHMCKVSTSSSGPVAVDGIICITQPNTSDIVVKIHETFSNVHASEKKEGHDSSSGAKRKSDSHDEGTCEKAPCQDGPRKKQKTVTRRQLLKSKEVLDLTDDGPTIKPEPKSPERSTKKTVDLTKGRKMQAPPQNVSQVQSPTSQSQARFSSPRGYVRQPQAQTQTSPRFVYHGNIRPPPLRNMSPNHGNRPPRGYGRFQSPGVRLPQGTRCAPPHHPGRVNVNRLMQPSGLTDVPSTSKMLECKYNDCSFSCKQKHHLETHVLKHLSSSLFSCNVEDCDYQTIAKQDLYQHYKKTHNAANPQFCFRCMQAFISPEQLISHKSNCQVKSVKCEHCGNRFEGLVSVAMHLTEIYMEEAQSTDGQAGSRSGHASNVEPSPSQKGSEDLPTPSHPTESPRMASSENMAQVQTPGIKMEGASPGTSQQSPHQSTANDEKLTAISESNSAKGCDLLMPVSLQSENDSGQTHASSSQDQRPSLQIDLNPAFTSKDEAMVTLLPLDMNSNLSLLPGTEGLTFDLFPLMSGDRQSENVENSEEESS